MPPKVVVGIPTLNTQSELTLLYEKVRSIRKKLWLMGYPDDFDSWDELDKAEWQMAREDERGESDGGVGAVRLGWPDFPRPRVGADAKAWPLE